VKIYAQKLLAFMNVPKEFSLFQQSFPTLVTYFPQFPYSPKLEKVPRWKKKLRLMLLCVENIWKIPINNVNVINKALHEKTRS